VIARYDANGEPIPAGFATEREYAQAEAAYLNNQSLLNLQNQSGQPAQNRALDDSMNRGTANATPSAPQTPNVNVPTNNSQKSTAKNNPQGAPGARKVNPLSQYSSSTYSLTLAMCTAEYYNQLSTVQPPGSIPPDNNNVFVVAQSGGINNSTTQRAITSSGTPGKGPGLDFYIEDLEFKSNFPNKDGIPSPTHHISFKIIEPLGFTFLQSLALASIKINSKSPLATKSSGASTSSNNTGLDQLFLLKIKFYGYDADGKIVNNGSSAPSNGKFSANTDPLAITERCMAIKIEQVTFKLDGKATVYDFTGYIFSEQVSYSQSEGTIKSMISLTGSTLQDILIGSTGSGSLMDRINFSALVEKSKNFTERNTTYEISFTPAAKTAMANARVGESGRQLSGLGTVTTTNQSNVNKSVDETTVSTKNNISIPQGQPISKIIEQIIIKSSYITDALNTTTSAGTESEATKNGSGQKLRWFTINPVVTITGYDEKKSDWSYNINYQIDVFDVPYIRSQYVSSKIKYPGAYKVYNYFFTGQNSEVLEYEQTFNNLYYIINTMSTSSDTTTVADVKATGAKVSPQNASGSDSTGGGLFKQNQINENVKAQLSSTDQTIATIRIIGDPDYISTLPGTLTSMAGSGVAQTSADAIKYYGATGYDINMYTSQIFIEINFQLATDYTSKGLMDVNDSVQFYNTSQISADKSKGGAGIKGMVYNISEIASTFSRGQFTQTLQLVLVPPDQLITNDTSTDQNRGESTSTSASAGNNSTQSASNGPARMTAAGGDLSITSQGGIRGYENQQANQAASAAISNFNNNQLATTKSEVAGLLITTPANAQYANDDKVPLPMNRLVDNPTLPDNGRPGPIGDLINLLNGPSNGPKLFVPRSPRSAPFTGVP
jgi:hypothetical protein